MPRSVVKYVIVLCSFLIVGLLWMAPSKMYHSNTNRLATPFDVLQFDVSPNLSNKSNTSYILLDWGPAYWKKNNHLKENDSVQNCIITRDRARLPEAHSILMDIREVRNNQDIPQERQPWQLWVFMNKESPYHAILDYPQTKLATFRGDKAFNWTMTYRQDSDVVMWYGRKLPLKQEDRISNEELRHAYRNKTKFLIGSASNCNYIPNHRDKWFRKLMELDPEVHIYGSCGNSGDCPGYLTRPGCDKTRDYKFFLAFENSNCKDYITEKFWWNGFHYAAIPVVMGATKSDIEKIAPENSFIHVDDFTSPAELLNYLHDLAENEEKFLEYLQWRHKYSIELHFRQMGNFGWELLCEAMNSRYDPNSSHRYPDIEKWISPKTDCTQNRWIKETFRVNDP